MRLSLFILPLALLVPELQFAQITITSAAFYAAGDSVRIATAINPQSISIGGSGENQTWDFTALEAADDRVSLFKNASEGSKPASFPGATLVGISAEGESYMQVTTNAINVLGFVGSGGFPLSQAVEPKYVPALPIQRAPMAFFDVNTVSSGLNFTFGADLLPDTLFAGSPFKPDSIRFTQTLDRLDVVESSGTLELPDGSYTVLRERRRTIADTKVEIKVGFIWIDLSTIFPLPGIGKDTSMAYYYFSNQAKGPIAIVEVDPYDNSVVLGVDYKGVATSSTYQPVLPEHRLFTGPVPAVESLTFNLEPLGSTAEVALFDMQGRAVGLYQGLQGQQIINVHHLQAGIYVYRVQRDYKLIETGTFMIQR